MITIALVTHSEKHTYGWREIWGTIETNQIRSYYVSGFGSAVISYQCLTADGWKTFKKKDQPKKVQKLIPVIKDYANKESLWDESTPYTTKTKFTSDPIDV